MTKKQSNDDIRDAVKKHYGSAITSSTGNAGCCGSGQTGSGPADQYAALAGYSADETAGLPNGITTFGCGNPVSMAGLKEGQVVLDLGSGAGLDLILAAGKVGATGKVIGLDMTPEMIEAGRKNLARAGIDNGEIRQGVMEKMPVADGEVDWIISNCVINLSPEKARVFAEAFRVLKPGGELLVSDIVVQDLPEETREDIMSWVGCIAGAVSEETYTRLLSEAGFSDIRVVDRFVYNQTSLATLAGESCCGGEAVSVGSDTIRKYADRVASVKVYARKPG